MRPDSARLEPNRSPAMPSASDHRSARRCLLGLATVLCAVTAMCGCRQQVSSSGVDITSSDSRLPEQDHFSIAIDFLKMRDEHNLERSASQATYHLNRWTRQMSADPQWIVERKMINTLPDAIRRAEATELILSDKALAQLDFRPSDIQYLEEARWLHATAKLIEQTPPPEKFQQWMKDAGMSRVMTRKLTACLAAFDWTVRNIQLDELREYPKTAAAGPVADPGNADPTATWPPPMRAEPGPGYTGHVWHVLMYGRGDSYQRARVFITLLRQLRIDAVMLGIDTMVGRAQPWLPAVFIENECYLFDPALGLPVPGPAEKGIATLSQAISNPEILTALTIGDNYVYPVGPSDLDNVVALIDASPESLSQRMVLAEKQLSAADQMVLTIAPAKLAAALGKSPGITDVRLWAVPIEASIYQQARAAVLAQNPQARFEDLIEHGIFQHLNPLVRGRRHYLLGRFNKRGDDIGAAGYFSQARMTDAALEDLTTSRRVQMAMGMERPDGMSEEDWQLSLDRVKTLQTQSKQHASYWMGLVHEQQGNYDVAMNWLTTRTLDKYPDGPWTDGARYNLARCHEALGEVEEAVKLYRIDESPQRHGNLLRAAILEQQAAAETPQGAEIPSTKSQVPNTSKIPKANDQNNESANPG